MSELRRGRRWLGIKWNCCSVYTRVYVDVSGRFYRGVCPRCCRTITVRVDPSDPDATSSRFFEVD